MSERIVAKLRRKMGKFALLVAKAIGEDEGLIERSVVDDTYQILCSLGHSEADARQLLEAAISTKKKFKDVDELLQAVYDTSAR
jgi:Holliday junction DNA helicase RuvA